MLAGKNSSETLVYQGYCDMSLICLIESRIDAAGKPNTSTTFFELY